MTDWIDKLAKADKEKFQAQRQADEKFNHEQRLKTSLEPQFWSELVKALQTNVNEFNQTFGSDVIRFSTDGTHQLRVQAQFTSQVLRSASAALQSDKHAMQWNELSPSKKSHNYTFDLVGDSKVVAVDEKLEKRGPEDLAKAIVTFLATA